VACTSVPSAARFSLPRLCRAGGLLSYGRRDEPTSGWENLVARDQARPAGTPVVAR